MKKYFILVFVLIFISSVYAQCGDPQSDYDPTYSTASGCNSDCFKGVKIEGKCYDCGYDGDDVCPEDFFDAGTCDTVDCDCIGYENDPKCTGEGFDCSVIEKCEDYDTDTCELDPCPDKTNTDGTINEFIVDDELVEGAIGNVMCMIEPDDICITCYICEACGSVGCTGDEAGCIEQQVACGADENEYCNDCDDEELLRLCDDPAFIEYCDSLKEPLGEEIIDVVEEPIKKFPIFTWFNLIITSLILIGFYIFIHKKK